MKYCLALLCATFLLNHGTAQELPNAPLEKSQIMIGVFASNKSIVGVAAQEFGAFASKIKHPHHATTLRLSYANGSKLTTPSYSYNLGNGVVKAVGYDHKAWVVTVAVEQAYQKSLYKKIWMKVFAEAGLSAGARKTYRYETMYNYDQPVSPYNQVGVLSSTSFHIQTPVAAGAGLFVNGKKMVFGLDYKWAIIPGYVVQKTQMPGLQNSYSVIDFDTQIWPAAVRLSLGLKL